MKQARSEQLGDDQCRLHPATGHYRTGIKITQTYIALLRSAVNFDEVIGPPLLRTPRVLLRAFHKTRWLPRCEVETRLFQGRNV